jgi:hypothetical protein
MRMALLLTRDGTLDLHGAQRRYDLSLFSWSSCLPLRCHPNAGMPAAN